MVVFSLELEVLAVGWRVLPVRVCTCLKRDREYDEKVGEGNIKTKGVWRSRWSEVESKSSGFSQRDNYEALR